MENPVYQAFSNALAIVSAAETLDTVVNTLAELSKEHVWAGNLLAAGRDVLQFSMNPLLAWAILPYTLYRFGSAAVNIAMGLRAGEGPIDISIKPGDLSMLPSNLINKGANAIGYKEDVIPRYKEHVEVKTIKSLGLHPEDGAFVGRKVDQAWNDGDQAIIDRIEAHETKEERDHRLGIIAALEANNFTPPEIVERAEKWAAATRADPLPNQFTPGKGVGYKIWHHPVTDQTWEEWEESRGEIAKSFGIA
jgi:hypothetical protein